MKSRQASPKSRMAAVTWAYKLGILLRALFGFGILKVGPLPVSGGFF